MKIKKFVILICFLLGASHIFSQTVLRGKIKDQTTGSPVANAKIGIKSQGVGVLSSSTGSFSYRKYNQVISKDDVLEINAPGYKTLEIDAIQLRELKNVASTFSLEKSSQASGQNESVDTAIFYLDISQAMKARNVETELDILISFLEEQNINNLKVIAFNNKIQAQKSFDNALGKKEDIKAFLASQKYSGPSDYSLITNETSVVTLLSSNGDGILGTPTIKNTNPVYVIASSKITSDPKWLESLTKYTGGAILGDKALNEDSGNLIRGKVTGPQGALQGVSIGIKGSFKEFKTKADGTFAIPANEGDVLTFSYLGMYPKSQRVENNEGLAIDLVSKNELLDEVLVSGRSRSDAEKETINTAFGKEKKDQIGYSVNNITSEDITPAMIYLSDVIRGKFAGVTVLGQGEDARFIIRTGATTLGNSQNPTGPVWVVDNVIYNVTPTWVPIWDIETISILKSSSAANRYGSIAIDGAFVITTKRSGPADSGVRDLRAKGNDYQENISVLSANKETPVFYSKVAKKSVQEQFEQYQKLKSQLGSDLEFFIDSARYFATKDKAAAFQILDDLTFQGSDNPTVLRIVGFMHQELNNTAAAAAVYERVVKLAPGSSQSYRDLARAYVVNKEYNLALEMYINMLGDQIKGVDFSGLETPLRNELRNLITRYKDKIDFKRLPNEWLDPNFNIDLRIVVEWTDAEVPFEFQFVNPNKKYFTWSHTLEENKERLYDENKKGYFLEEFIVDDAPSGEWLINVRFLGEASDFVIPPFLKYTVYKNYGTPQETKETKIIKLYEQVDKVTVSKIRV